VTTTLVPVKTNYPIHPMFRASLRVESYRCITDTLLERPDWDDNPQRLAFVAAQKLMQNWERYVCVKWLENTEDAIASIESYRPTVALVARYFRVCQLAYLGPGKS
jgi:hypothetical protein